MSEFPSLYNRSSKECGPLGFNASPEVSLEFQKGFVLPYKKGAPDLCV